MNDLEPIYFDANLITIGRVKSKLSRFEMIKIAFKGVFFFLIFNENVWCHKALNKIICKTWINICHNIDLLIRVYNFFSWYVLVLL